MWWTLIAVAAAAPEDVGPYAVSTWDAGDVDIGGVGIPVVVYAPDAAPAGPVVAVVHGFGRNGDTHADTAAVLASHGMVAVVPDMPCGFSGCDHDANAAQVSGLLDWAVGEGAGGGPLAGKVDGERRGVIGHSWGGLAVFLAAARDDRIDSVFGFDPVDDSGLVASEIANIGVPSAAVFAEAENCCNDAWETDVFPGATAPKLMATIATSGHCDPESPTDGLCAWACCDGNPATAPTWRRYALAWTRCVLQADTGVAGFAGGTEFDADVAAGLLANPVVDGVDALPCRAPPVDTGDTADTSDSGGDDSDAPGDGPSAGGRCGCAPGGAVVDRGLAGALGIAALAAGRRKRTDSGTAHG
jgi:dienelactone hydrolase